MHLVSSTQTSLAFLPRIIVAVVLVLALLSGIAPLSSASAEHLCTMECCATLAPHAAGSCHMEMSSHGKPAGSEIPNLEPARLCELPEADAGKIKGVAGGVMGMKTSADPNLDLAGVTIDVSEHCNTNSQSEDVSASHKDSSQPASVAAPSFSKPCPPECGTGVLSSGIRPSRELAALAYNARPRPPTLTRNSRYLNFNFSINSADRKQVRPRGPPLSFS